MGERSWPALIAANSNALGPNSFSFDNFALLNGEFHFVSGQVAKFVRNEVGFLPIVLPMVLEEEEEEQ